jgi:integrase
MGVYKRGKFYWYKFVWNGEPIAVSTKQSNKEVAKNQEQVHRQRLSNAELKIREKKPVPTLAEYFEKTIIPWAETQFVEKPKSLKWYRDNQKVLLNFPAFKDIRLDEIGKAAVEDFKQWRSKQGVGVHTVNSSLRVLRAVLHRASLERLRDPLIKGEIVILPGAQSREHVVTREEEKKYLGHCTEPLRTIAMVMVDMAFRPEECFRMKWECLTFTNDGGRIFNEFGKSKAARRSVSMTQRVRDILMKRWIDAGKPRDGWVFPAQKAEVGHVVPNTIYEPHLEAIKTCKVRPFVLYSLRHTCLTRLGQSGCDIYTLARIAGWSNINMAKHYVHMTDDQTEQAIKRMEASDSNQEHREVGTNLVQSRKLRSAQSGRRVSLSRSSIKS